MSVDEAMLIERRFARYPLWSRAAKALLVSLCVAGGLWWGIVPLAAAPEPTGPIAPGGRPLTRPAIRTNAPAITPTFRPATNALARPGLVRPLTNTLARPGLARPGLAKPPTNPPTPTASATTNGPAADNKAGGSLTDTLRRLPSNQAFYPALVALFLAGLLLVKFFQSKSGKPGAGPGVGAGARRRAAVQRCNVLQAQTQSRQLWGFQAHNGGFQLDRSQLSMAGESLPSGMIGKNWRALWQPKLNIAWLPPENVFLRVTQLPRSDFKETLSMVELQMEKLSPMPVAQVVWSIFVLPQPEEELQTVIVAIVARNVVEEFLGQLEGQGYIADRIELPFVDQLRAAQTRRDGAWIYPEARGATNSAVVAWWQDGVLQNLDVIGLPSADRPASVREQLTQTAWAGELEGWLKGPPRWHLVADSPAAAEWEPLLRSGLDEPVEVSAPLPGAQLAALTAQRAAHAEPGGELLPSEFSTRYQEQFYDRLWMRGLLAVGGLYCAGVLCYMAAVQFLVFRAKSVESEWGALSNSYTNAMQLKARFQVLKERQELKFAALDAYRAVAENMPESLTLDGFNLTDGHRLSLNGSAARDQAKDILDFDAALRKTMVNGQLLFSPDKGDHATYQQSPSGLSWRMSMELNRTEGE